MNLMRKQNKYPSKRTFKNGLEEPMNGTNIKAKNKYTISIKKPRFYLLYQNLLYNWLRNVVRNMSKVIRFNVQLDTCWTPTGQSIERRNL